MSASFQPSLLPLALDGPLPERRRRRQISREIARKPVQQWPLDEDLTVVLFCGMGGTCEGFEDAGFPVQVGLNHDRIAIAAHTANHPHTRHLQADIFETPPLVAVRGKRVGRIWASPDCRDFSSAKGGAPRSARVRSMPWQMCRWVGVLRKRNLGPDVVFLENVREIRGWGPLIAKRDKATGRVLKLDGTVAAKGERVPREQQHLVRDPKRIGKTYRAWCKHIRGLGPNYEDRDLDCSEYGVPTSRKRLFGVGRFDGQPVVWPRKTHGHRKSAAVLAGRLLPAVSAASIIDWSLPLPSIFDRKKALAFNTQRRIAVGMRRFVLETDEPFLVSISCRPAGQDWEYDRRDAGLVPAIVPTTHTGEGRVHDGVGSLPALTAGVKGGELAVMAAHLSEFRSHSIGHDAGDPAPSATAQDHHAVIAASLIQTGYGEREGQAPRALDLEAPIGTQMAEGAKHGVIGAYLAEHRGCSIGQPVDQALGAQTAFPHHGVVGVYMAQHNGDPRQSGEEAARPGRSAADPAGTLTTQGGQVQVVAAHLTEFRTGHVGRDMKDSLQTVTSNGHQETRQGGAIPIGVVGAELVPAAAWMLQNNYMEPGHSPEDPTATLVQKVGPVAVGAAYLTRLRGTGTASSVEDTTPAQTAGGDKGGGHEAVTAAYLGKYYGVEGQGQPVDGPLDTLSTNDRFGVTGAALAVPPLSPAQIARAREVAEFLREHGVWSGGEFVTVGDRWIVVDIGMRMLKPHEAAAAHELKLPDLIEVAKLDRKGQPVLDFAGRPVMIKRPLTKTEAMRLVGNSVPKRMATLLIQANTTRTIDRPMRAAA